VVAQVDGVDPAVDRGIDHVERDGQVGHEVEAADRRAYSICPSVGLEAAA
jgi:hypothetical protein